MAFGAYDGTASVREVAMDLPFEIVDVFAEQPLHGNQLAVVLPPRPLADAQMLAIAREFAFSETTFVDLTTTPAVRIFTPAEELPFAGHPILGTAAVLRARTADRATALTLTVAGRSLAVRFAPDGVVWLGAPEAQRTGECDRAELKRHLSLRDEQLTHDPFTVWDVGPRFVLVELADLDALTRLQPDRGFFAWLRAHCGALGVYAFTSDAYGPEAHYATRMFFLADQVREDAATGSAAICLAAYLRESGRDPGDIVELEQGHELQRPARIHLRIGEQTELGGRVTRVGRGILELAD